MRGLPDTGEVRGETMADDEASTRADDVLRSLAREADE